MNETKPTAEAYRCNIVGQYHHGIGASIRQEPSAVGEWVSARDYDAHTARLREQLRLAVEARKRWRELFNDGNDSFGVSAEAEAADAALKASGVDPDTKGT